MRGSVRKRGNRWYYSFELPTRNGKRKRIERVGGDTKPEAEKALTTALNELNETGRFFESSKSPLEDYMWYWFAEYALLNLKENTQENYRMVIKKHIAPPIGDIALRDLTPTILQTWINDKRREGYSDKSMSIFRCVINSALRHAVYPWGLLKENPMQYVTMPKRQRKKVSKEEFKIIKRDDLIRIMEYLKSDMPLYMPFHIGLHTGLRVSEVCGLLWRDIDLNEGTLTVERAMVNSKGEWVLSSTKTASSERTIPLGPTIIKLLKEHRLWIKKNKLFYGPHYIDSEHVCVKESGEPITPSSMKYNTNKLKKELQIPFNFHSLRHTHATMLMENGAKIKDIQARLGHSRSAITIDTYSHLTEKMQKESVDIFERALDDIK
ncbi:tyrosine-type recombinase/integrase [Lysinibacillus sphaericus]|uniref:Phage integrase n=2 Tax=Lysinibacillus TaxID=400634 RepID=R7ZCH1_LYSSH|nr:tyrosine-type recombinase/integrase [Lysinibacillus sphaericus]EON71803.1 Phage integrase [Lysinibacillus sphaericus OT4b.31]